MLVTILTSKYSTLKCGRASKWHFVLLEDTDSFILTWVKC